MTLHPLHGHEALRRRLSHAVAGGRLPQSLLLEGPPGVGKQRIALWLAQRLVCEAPTDEGEPCETCPPCRLTLKLSHPDVHWFVPIELQSPGGDADRQVEAAEELLGEVLAARRDQPLYGPPAGMASHPLASVRLLLRRLALRPALGGPRVFVLGDAERLRPQTGIEAAPNALLKALEEPPPDTYFVLTAADPGALLPTIVSRVVRVRVARVPDSVAAAFAQSAMNSSASDSKAMAYTAGGCIGRIVANLDGGSGPREAASRFLAAARKGPLERYGQALSQPPFEARGAFTEMLDSLLERLRDEAAAGGDTGRLVEAISRVLDTRTLARGNVNPQLLAAVLADDLSEQAGEDGR
jgi:DNA polymerase-3 subunit delta'